MYTENSKILMKEIEEHINKWKVYHIHGLVIGKEKFPYYLEQSTDSIES
jgi:hypothetical protein